MASRVELDKLDRIVNQYNGKNGLEIDELNTEVFRAKVGSLYVDTLPAKEPGQPWADDLKYRVENARRTFDDYWGPVPLTDTLDEVSRVDCAWVFDESTKRGKPDKAAEGLTMRTVRWTQKAFLDPDYRPDDTRFFVGPDNIPYINVIANELFDGDVFKAMDLIVAASRLAPIRNSETKEQGHNEVTPEVFAALQVISVYNAVAEGKTHHINTMKPSIREDVLMLPPTGLDQEGVTYEHTPAEITLGLKPGSIKLNRYGNDPDRQYTLMHFFNYPGYFFDEKGLNSFLKDIFGNVYPKNDILERIEGLGIPSPLIQVADLLRPDVLGNLKPSQFKRFGPVFKMDGQIMDGLTGNGLKTKALKKVGDGARPYLMDAQTRFREAFKVLAASPAAREPGLNERLMREKIVRQQEASKAILAPFIAKYGYSAG